MAGNSNRINRYYYYTISLAENLSLHSSSVQEEHLLCWLLRMFVKRKKNEVILLSHNTLSYLISFFSDLSFVQYKKYCIFHSNPESNRLFVSFSYNISILFTINQTNLLHIKTHFVYLSINSYSSLTTSK